jgi:hypothetical protein
METKQDFSEKVKKSKSIERKFTAITDGQLQHTSTYEIRAIVECKTEQRERCTPNVDMQEAAQMVSWIKEYPNSERQ